MDALQSSRNARTLLSILRHESFATTQTYLHIEEKRRYKEIQKIRMDIEPKIIMQKTKELEIELKLCLKGGPLNKEFGLERFISILETQILCGLKWNRKEALVELLDRYQKIKIIKGTVELIYKIEGSIDSMHLEYIKRSIAREAEIRLFDCQLSLATK